MKQAFYYLSAAITSMLLVSGTISCKSTQKKIIINTEVADDATMAVLQAIEKVNAGEADEIYFEKGTYNFYPDKAIEKYTHSSNHGDYMSRIAFYIDGADGLSIDGNGSDFVFHNRIYPFFVTNSENVDLKNFSINSAERFSSEPLVVANDEENRTFDIKIPEGEQYEIRDGILYFVKPDYEYTIGQSILYDPLRESIAFNTERYTPISGYARLPKPASFEFKYQMDKNDTYQKIRGKEYRLGIQDLGDGIIRISNHKKALPPVGMLLSCKGEQGYNRLAPAVKFENTKNLNAENVIVYHASGMGFLGENCEDVVLDGCKVIPSKGYMVSTTADATHFVGCRGKLVLKDCTFRNQLDDATNIHGAYQPIVDIVDSNTIGVRMGHFQQQGFVQARVGDSIGFVRILDSFHAYDTRVVTDIKYINGRYNLITFDKPLPSNLKVGDLTENLSAYPTVEITGCYVGGNRARGLLISTHKGTLIENNTFSTEMEAILMPVESGHWYESGNAANVIIRNNVFEDCSFGGINRGVINFKTDDDVSNIAFTNITVEDNEFKHFDNLIVEAKNVDGFVFRNNTITNSGTFPQLYPKNPVMTFEHCKNVNLDNNTYEGKATTMVKMLDKSAVIPFK